MSYTRDWDESTPADHTKFKVQPSHVRDSKTDLAERLADFFYGFTAGETDTGIKYIKAIVQTTAPDTALDSAMFYTMDSDDVAEWFIKDEEGNEIQLTKAGKINMDDAQISNNTYLVSVDSTGTGTINIAKVNTADELEISPVTIIPDTSRMASDAAPSEDAEIANKKYVDDQITANLPSFMQANGTSNITTTSTSLVNMTDMSLSLPAGTWLIMFSASFKPTAASSIIQTNIKVGSNVRATGECHPDSSAGDATNKVQHVSLQWAETIESETTVVAQWKSLTSGTIGQEGSVANRVLTAVKLS